MRPVSTAVVRLALIGLALASAVPVFAQFEEQGCPVRRLHARLAMNEGAPLASLLPAMGHFYLLGIDEREVLMRVRAEGSPDHLEALYAIEVATRCPGDVLSLNGSVQAAMEASGAPSSAFVAIVRHPDAPDCAAANAVTALAARADPAVREALAEAVERRSGTCYIDRRFAEYETALAHTAAFDAAPDSARLAMVLAPLVGAWFPHAATWVDAWQFTPVDSTRFAVQAPQNGMHNRQSWSLRRLAALTRDQPSAVAAWAQERMDAIAEVLVQEPDSALTERYKRLTPLFGYRPIRHDSSLVAGRRLTEAALRFWSASPPTPYPSEVTLPPILSGTRVRPFDPIPTPGCYRPPSDPPTDPDFDLDELAAHVWAPDDASFERVWYLLTEARARPDASSLRPLYTAEAALRCASNAFYENVLLALEASGAPSSFFLSLVADPHVPDRAARAAVEVLGVRSDGTVWNDLAHALTLRSGAERIDDAFWWYDAAVAKDEEYAAAADTARARMVLSSILSNGYSTGQYLYDHPSSAFDESSTYVQHEQLTAARSDDPRDAWERRRLPALVAESPEAVRLMARALLAEWRADRERPLTPEDSAANDEFDPDWAGRAGPSPAYLAAGHAGALQAVDVWGFHARPALPYASYGPVPPVPRSAYDLAVLPAGLLWAGRYTGSSIAEPDTTLFQMAAGSSIAGEDHDLAGAPLLGAPSAFGVAARNPTLIEGALSPTQRARITGADSWHSASFSSGWNGDPGALVGAALVHPDLLRQSKQSYFGSSVARPALYYVDGPAPTTLRGTEGYGVLIADGTVVLAPGFTWHGLLIVREGTGGAGRLVLGSGARIVGAAGLVGDDVQVALGEGAAVLRSTVALRIAERVLSERAPLSEQPRIITSADPAE